MGNLLIQDNNHHQDILCQDNHRICNFLIQDIILCTDNLSQDSNPCLGNNQFMDKTYPKILPNSQIQSHNRKKKR